MKELAQLLAELQANRIIGDYAVFGAVAQIRYTEPVATLDIDVLVVPLSEGLDILAPIYAHCRARGHRADGEEIRVGAWPVQFIPVFSDLTREAVEQAEVADFEGLALRVVRADHLAAIALATGRAKDLARIVALLEAGAVSRQALAGLADRHGLAEAWRRFEFRFLDD